jgi:hypothetical protein
MASKLRTLQTDDFGFTVVVAVEVGLPEMKGNKVVKSCGFCIRYSFLFMNPTFP